MNWQDKIYESLTERHARYGGMVGYSGGGGKNKHGVIMSIETDKDGKKFVVRKNKEGKEVARLKEWNDDTRYDIRNNIREVNKQIHGNYAYEDRTIMQTMALGRLAMQFHKWVANSLI